VDEGSKEGRGHAEVAKEEVDKETEKNPFAPQEVDADDQEPADARYDISDIDDLPITKEPADAQGAADTEIVDKSGTDADAADDFDDLAFVSTDETMQDEIGDEHEEDFAFLSDSDEAATKLDLARAYIDMGDIDGAREILGEVLQEGTETQRRDAEVLMDRL
jgi:pilus assembly protein FimV